MSLPLKFVDPMRIAINSLPSILNINSKLFSVMLTARGFSVSVIFLIFSDAKTSSFRIIETVFGYSYVAKRHPLVRIMYYYSHSCRVCSSNTKHYYAAN